VVVEVVLVVVEEGEGFVEVEGEGGFEGLPFAVVDLDGELLGAAEVGAVGGDAELGEFANLSERCASRVVSIRSIMSSGHGWRSSDFSGCMKAMASLPAPGRVSGGGGMDSVSGMPAVWAWCRHL